MSAENERRRWERAINGAIGEPVGMLTTSLVLEEVDSTQVPARDCSVGTVVVALRQRGGRGRLGRLWADTGEDGLAVTFVLPAGTPERIAIASAIATATAIENATGRSPGIKWPNDVVFGRQKAAGILVEQAGERALVGIGINVSQTTWPAELADRAVSLLELGATVDRLDLLLRLMAELSRVAPMDDEALREAFAQRDVLTGSDVQVRSGERRLTGKVRYIDPLRGLRVDAPDAEFWLPAALTSIEAWSPASDTEAGDLRRRAE